MRDQGHDNFRREPWPRNRLHNVAVFIEVESALAGPADDAAVLPCECVAMLRKLAVHSHGAVALVSTRDISWLDALLFPLLLPAAGLHGLERRNAVGQYRSRPAPGDREVQAISARLQSFARVNPEVSLTGRGTCLSIDYRRAPRLARQVMLLAAEVTASGQSEFAAVRGDGVVEIRPERARPATALAEFMQETPFAGRTPLFVGMDGSALDWVSRMGGHHIPVAGQPSPPPAAPPAAVRSSFEWLWNLLSR